MYCQVHLIYCSFFQVSHTLVSDAVFFFICCKEKCLPAFVHKIKPKYGSCCLVEMKWVCVNSDYYQLWARHWLKFFPIQPLWVRFSSQSRLFFCIFAHIIIHKWTEMKKRYCKFCHSSVSTFFSLITQRFSHLLTYCRAPLYRCSDALQSELCRTVKIMTETGFAACCHGKLLSNDKNQVSWPHINHHPTAPLSYLHLDKTPISNTLLTFDTNSWLLCYFCRSKLY